jgi:hypothetical protein
MLEGKSFDSEYSLFETCSFDTQYSDDKNERIKNSITDSLISQHTYEYTSTDILLGLCIVGIYSLILTFLVVYFF